MTFADLLSNPNTLNAFAAAGGAFGALIGQTFNNARVRKLVNKIVHPLEERIATLEKQRHDDAIAALTERLNRIENGRTTP